jgi:hypothetical protein
MRPVRDDVVDLLPGQRTLLVREPFEIPRDAEVVWVSA